jgi:outer membrane receptor protein involved in Fe transport
LLLAAGAVAQPGATGAPETIIVTASRTEETLLESSAAVTVLDSAALALTPGDDYGDLLRGVPGLNVAQTSVRDISITARGATSTLANSQLALVDGRSIYLDFFGFVAWDLLPVQTQEIARIEVVRGPGSAVWGANAMSGVVNVITKRPRDLVGTTVIVGTAESSVLHASASERFAYKVTAGRFEQSPYERPTGEIPGSVPTQTYPTFANRGTEQHRAAAELEWDLAAGGVLTFGGAYADTGGILHSGIGPFDVEDRSSLSSVKANWRKDAWRVGVAANRLDGDAVNLLTLRADGEPLSFEFASDTIDVNVSNSTELGTRHTLTYGADYRSNDFRLEIAPGAADRDEWGVFVQAELAAGERTRWSIGARYHEADALADAAVVPRTSLVFTPRDGHALRLSYGEAFRSPSAINEYLDVTILQQVGPFALPGDADGNLALDEELLTALEVGYTATLRDGMTLSVDLYRNEITDSIDFFVARRYGAGNLPEPSATLPPAIIPCFNFAPGSGPAACPFGGLSGLVPSNYSYQNIGRIVNDGVEIGLTGNRNAWRWFANASWQSEPEIAAGGVAPEDVNVAPSWRANAGIGRDSGRRFWSVALNYQGEAYWADVLFARAFTSSFTQVGATAGWRFVDDHLTLKVIGQNVLDADVQQHIFGDMLERRIEGQLSYTF